MRGFGRSAGEALLPAPSRQGAGHIALPLLDRAKAKSWRRSCTSARPAWRSRPTCSIFLAATARRRWRRRACARRRTVTKCAIATAFGGATRTKRVRLTRRGFAERHEQAPLASAPPPTTNGAPAPKASNNRAGAERPDHAPERRGRLRQPHHRAALLLRRLARRSAH